MSHQYAATDETITDMLPAIGSDADQTAALTRIIESVSAAIDQYTKRPAGYFSPVAGDAVASVRRYRGTGANYLQIGRHVPDNVAITGVDSTLFYEHPENGWLFAVDEAGQTGVGPYDDRDDARIQPFRLFGSGSLYLVSAIWGFAATPDDIRLATMLIAQQIWDRGRGVVGEISPAGFVIERDMPLTARTILDRWTKREFELN